MFNIILNILSTERINTEKPKNESISIILEEVVLNEYLPYHNCLAHVQCSITTVKNSYLSNQQLVKLRGLEKNIIDVKLTPLPIRQEVCWGNALEMFCNCTPAFKGSVESIVSKACRETEIYLKNDIDGIIVENMHDIPYIQSKHFGPEITATMSRICMELRKIIPKNIPTGIQVLAGGNSEALAVAKACSLDFIRAEGYVFSHIADEGFMDANAGLLLRYRKNIQADDILIFTDIKKKHSSHAITSDLTLSETAKAAEFFLSDGLIITGTSTGDPANIKDLEDLKSCTSLPVLVGSGVTLQNMLNYMSADALIVGSYFKQHGKWNGDLDESKINCFMKTIKDIR